jgi:hypothetical protein
MAADHPGPETQPNEAQAWCNKFPVLSDVIERALELIKPKPEQRAACAGDVKDRVQMLMFLHRTCRNVPSPGTLRNEFNEIADFLKNFRRGFNKFSAISRAMIFWKDPKREEAFFKELDQRINAAQLNHDWLIVPPGGHRWNDTAAMAAKYAEELLRQFSAKPPTKTKGGAFYQLASLLYEAATGKKNVALEQYCRVQLDDPDRFGPGIRLRIPPDRIGPSLIASAVPSKSRPRKNTRPTRKR